MNELENYSIDELISEIQRRDGVVKVDVLTRSDIEGIVDYLSDANDDIILEPNQVEEIIDDTIKEIQDGWLGDSNEQIEQIIFSTSGWVNASV